MCRSALLSERPLGKPAALGLSDHMYIGRPPFMPHGGQQGPSNSQQLNVCAARFLGKGHVARAPPSAAEEPSVGVAVAVSWNKGNGPTGRIGVSTVERRVCVIV
eukprot:5243597-Pyramimonas_sp.AAC.1